MGWIRLPFFLSLFAVSTFLSHWHDPTCKFSFTKYAVCSAGKESVCNVEDLGSIPGLGRSPGEGKGYQLQDSCLENSTHCVVHGVAEPDTTGRLSLSLPGCWQQHYLQSPGCGSSPVSTNRDWLKRTEYYSVMKNEVFPFATTWMDLESVMLSEIGGQRETHAVWRHMRVGSKKYYKLVNKTEKTDSHIQRTN